MNWRGKGDWRLPNRNELQSIVDYSLYNPAIDTIYFPDTVASDYWSSTTSADYTSYAWLVGFNYGYVGNNYKSSYYFYVYVRAVRGGQCGGLSDLDHFDITAPDGSSIGNQTVNNSFPIKITARDGIGNIVNYNGAISLWSNAGYQSVCPNPVTLINGAWNGSISLNGGGNNIYLQAGIIGKYRTSEPFEVYGQQSGFGNLSGEIRDNNGLLVLSSTKVILNGDYHYEITVDNGKYQFNTNLIACGKYTIYNICGTNFPLYPEPLI